MARRGPRRGAAIEVPRRARFGAIIAAARTIAGLYRSAGRTRDRALGGIRGDSYDNALAEAVNAAYKTELINRAKPWRCIDDVELATAEWVAWNNRCTGTRLSATRPEPSTRTP